MELNEYQRLSKRTVNSKQRRWDQLTNATLGLAGEAGEFTDAIKKVLFHDHDLKENDLAEELGDVLFYLSWLADILGYTLEEVAQMNVDKLKRRYPEGFDTEKSKTRTE